MIKLFLESDKFSHIAGVTLHATNSLARKSLIHFIIVGRSVFIAVLDLILQGVKINFVTPVPHNRNTYETFLICLAHINL